MDDEDRVLLIDHKDDLQQPVATSSAPNEPFAIASIERVGPGGAPNQNLCLVWLDTVLLNVLPVPRVSPKVHTAS